ncbi:MAG: RNA methyltransferase [Hyphomicrobiales bacterium]|nr:MAG: RNA methyltransferase [Hyphomicrobiales bacterium]
MADHRITLTIDHVGHRGDGVAFTDDGPAYVSLTLAGETVTVERDGNRLRLVEVVSPSAERADPPCPHFGHCGGCMLQHMSGALYRDWKHQQVAAAFAQRGLDVEIAPLTAAEPGTRRRAVLTARRAGKRIALGYHAAQTHQVVDLKFCPVLMPAIVSALPALREIAAIAAPKRGGLRLTVLATGSGLDVALGDAAKLSRRDEQKLIDIAIKAGFARLSLDDELLVATVEPVLDFDSIAVVPPPGAFVQASADAERAMAKIIDEATVGATRIADLFSGVGTFALRLAKRSAVHAVEGDGAALAALENATRHVSGLKPVTMERRDLFEVPLAGKELETFDAVVFDPPRAGARAQAEMLAASPVATVVAVSCNPATLARDAKLLVDGGYRIMRMQPVDQFLWSPHIECVAVFSRV